MKFKLIVFCVFLQSQFPVYSQLWGKLDFKLSYGPNKLYFDSSENKLIILGKFTKLNDTISARGIVAWDGQNYETFGTGFDDDQTLYTQSIFDAIKYKDKLYVGGFFNKAGNVFTKYLAQWDGNQWDSVSNRFDDGVNCLKIINDTLYIGGYQKKVGNIDVEGIVKYDGINFYTLPSFYPYNVLNISVIDYFNGHLYVGGLIKDSTGYQVGVMKLVGNKWITVGQGIRGSAVDINKMIIYKNKLILGGYFLENNVNVDSFIQAWNDTIWSSLGGGTGNGNGAIFDMAIIEDKLHCVGVLTSAGGIDAEKYAIWDGVNWCSTGAAFDNTILSIAHYKDTTFIVGGFWSIDGDTTKKYMAKWTGGNYIAACGNTTLVNKHEIENLITVFPNPTNNLLHLDFNYSKNYSIMILNNIGQSVLEFKNTNTSEPINISTLAKGLYILKVCTNEKIYTTKFFKQ